MEHISKDLERLNQGTHINPQKSIEPPIDDVEEPRELKLERLRRALGLSSLEHTFDNFNRAPGTVAALEAFKSMVDGTARPMLLCYGGVGNGKTHLCEALAIELYKKGIRCPVTIWSDVMRMFKKGMHRGEPDDPSYDYLFENFRRRERLILDDVGMGSKDSAWEWCELEDIINYRYRERLFTVMATNKGMDELPERVVSRFSDPEKGVVVLNKGKDYRTR